MSYSHNISLVNRVISMAKLPIDFNPLSTPNSKVHGANMGPIWGWQDPGGPHVGPMNFAIWDWFQIYTGVWFNIKMVSYQYSEFHCGDKTVVRSSDRLISTMGMTILSPQWEWPSYLCNGNSYPDKTACLFWDIARTWTWSLLCLLITWQW